MLNRFTKGQNFTISKTLQVKEKGRNLPYKKSENNMYLPQNLNRKKKLYSNQKSTVGAQFSELSMN